MNWKFKVSDKWQSADGFFWLTSWPFRDLISLFASSTGHWLIRLANYCKMKFFLNFNGLYECNMILVLMVKMEFFCSSNAGFLCGA